MNPRGPTDEPNRVPLFGTWQRAYLSVALFFLLQVAAYYLLTLAVS